jgi:hypothetical protein
VETAQALERQAELEAKERQEQARQVEAWQHAQAVIALNEELDLALMQHHRISAYFYGDAPRSRPKIKINFHLLSQ